MVRSFEQVRYGCWCNAWKEGKEKIITKDFCEGRMRVGGKEGQLVSHPSSAVCALHTTHSGLYYSLHYALQMRKRF